MCHTHRYLDHLSQQGGAAPSLYSQFAEEQHTPSTASAAAAASAQEVGEEEVLVVASGRGGAAAGGGSGDTTAAAVGAVRAAVEGALVEVLGKALPPNEPLMSGAH